MKRKRITAATIALVCAGTLCLPVQAAKPSGMEEVQGSGDPDLENTFEFTVNDQTDDEIVIGPEGSELSIPAVDFMGLEQFYEEMLNGAYL